MKFNFKSFTLGFVISSIIFTSLSLTFAKVQNINAFFNDIKVKVNGREVENMDVEPFIYQGRTFVPVRFVAEELDMEVKWNETTNTVELDSIKKEENKIMSENQILTKPDSTPDGISEINKIGENYYVSTSLITHKYNNAFRIFVNDERTLATFKDYEGKIIIDNVVVTPAYGNDNIEYNYYVNKIMPILRGE
jgi:hypothetical protein